MKKISNNFSKKTKNFLLCRFLCTWKALIHSILISKVTVTKTHVLQACGEIPNKKTLKLHLELNFINFQN